MRLQIAKTEITLDLLDQTTPVEIGHIVIGALGGPLPPNGTVATPPRPLALPESVTAGSVQPASAAPVLAEAAVRAERRPHKKPESAAQAAPSENPSAESGRTTPQECPRCHEMIRGRAGLQSHLRRCGQERPPPHRRSEKVACDKCGRMMHPQGLGTHRKTCKGAPSEDPPELDTSVGRQTPAERRVLAMGSAHTLPGARAGIAADEDGDE